MCLCVCVCEREREREREREKEREREIWEEQLTSGTMAQKLEMVANCNHGASMLLVSN